MARYGIDLTACWRPRVGMVTHAVELSRALLEVIKKNDLEPPRDLKDIFRAYAELI